VNLTPDKRLILLNDEESIFGYLREMFVLFFEDLLATQQINEPSRQSQLSQLLQSPISSSQTSRQPSSSQPTQELRYSTGSMLQETASYHSSSCVIQERGSPPETGTSDSLHYVTSADVAILSSLNTETENPAVNPQAQNTPSSIANISGESDHAGLGLIGESSRVFLIQKSDFEKMTVIGQFNLGFIIAELKTESEKHLMIIDQHAADEKYRYEMYQRETQLPSQPLIIPRQLELPTLDEILISENICIFESHGFKLKFNPEETPTKRIQLTAIPHSRRKDFGLGDIEEILGKLREESHESIELSKLDAINASRACRTAVMVGTALTKSQMATIVANLGTLKSPWNCPHGRPTIRYLYQLPLISE
jgi:DNA mismatch repair ATPase MutL